MPRGGARTPTPGKAYGQRTDLNKQPPRFTPPSAEYGQGVALKNDQQQVPITQPGAGAAIPAQGGPQAPAPSGPMPGQVTPLDAPTERPDEPVTAGMPFGAGPGPEALTPAPSPLLLGVAALNSLGDNVSSQVKALRSAAQAHLNNQAAP